MSAQRRIPRAVWREAFTLPLIFLIVSLGGGLRIGVDGALQFMPPPLMALVLAVILLGVLYRSGALLPERLVRADRSVLDNLGGIVVIATLFAAAAQVFNALTPEAGLLAFAMNIGWLALLGNTLAARPDRARLLSSLLVVFGAAFVVKYVLLGALYAPDGGLMKRVVLALLDGVSLGTLAYQPPGPATGYVAFFVVLLFLAGIALLPRADVPAAEGLILTGEAVTLPDSPPARHRADR